MNKKTLKDISLKDKKVFMRADFNVPLNEKNEITDDIRITESIPSIKYILEQGASIILASHLGRPKGKYNISFSLKPVADRLAKLLGCNIIFANDCIGEEVKTLKENLKTGEILLLENVRFHKEEEENNRDFSKQLIDGADIFVNDAFGTAHRAHSSTTGVSEFVEESIAGFLIEKEINYLIEVINRPKIPFTAIIGGAKISGKIDVINKLFEKVDNLLVGGGMIFTFYKAMGLEIGKSLVEDDKVQLASELIAKAKDNNVRFLLPTDLKCSYEFSNDSESKTVSFKNIPSDMMGLDIGPETIANFSEVIRSSGTIIWNGPMGAFEMPNYSEGTYKVAKALADMTKSGGISIVGGGDSASAVQSAGIKKDLSHISTGGGASLELLEGKVLPGIDCLTNK